MNNMPDTSSMTLESIALRKKELRKKLHAQKEIMTDTAENYLLRLHPLPTKVMLSCVPLIQAWLFSTD